MRAFGFRQHGPADVAEDIEVDQPEPLGGELLVEVRAAAVNPVDYKIRSGAFGERDLPAVMGSEASGVVRGLGPDVQGFTVGDEVFGVAAPNSGSFAEYATLTADSTAHKPVHVSWVDAATLAVAAATAYDGVTQLGLTAGQTLLINGASGGVGVAAAQIARDFGITVIGTAREENRELLESMGATLVTYGEGVADRVREILPQGVDAVFDLAGGDAMRAVADLVTDRSKLISAGDESVEELGGHDMERDHGRGPLDAVAAMVADGKLDPHVEDVVPLDRAAEAVAAVEVGHARGKVVVQVA